MLAPLPHVTGIEYRKIYNLTVFDCTSLRATIQPHHCAANWTARHDGSACIGCKVGQAHAGKTEAPPAASKVCCRCERPASRIIGGALCVSCFNRTREVVLGTNRKGGRPWHTGKALRRGFAVVRVPDAMLSLAEVFAKRPGVGSSFLVGINPCHLPGVPDLTALDSTHIWLSGIVTGADEMQRIVSRLLPDGEIIESEFSESFADQWRSRDDTMNSETEAEHKPDKRK